MTDESRQPAPDQVPTSAPATIQMGTLSLEQLRGIVLTNPRLAQRVLTDKRVPDEVVRETLRAETLIRLGHIDNVSDAATAAARAIRAAANEKPVAAARLLPPAVILADCAVLADAPDAASSCIDLKHLARDHADLPRMLIAACLRGVAIYHQHSCQHARHLFSRLHAARTRAAGPDALTRALAEARDTIDACCAARDLDHKPPQPSAFTIGALVQPEPLAGALADRILRLPGRHECCATA